MLVFVTPHQFMEGICKRLVGKIRSDAEAISLIKGMEVKKEGPCMISSLISEQLGINCCVLMGANIANEVILQILMMIMHLALDDRFKMIVALCRLHWRSLVRLQ